MNEEPTILKLRGADLLPWIDTLGDLRIRIFREFPYLYDGDLSHEREYLKVYVACADSLVGMVTCGGKVIGATTCMPMEKESEGFRRPFEQAGLDPKRVLYLGESLLLPEWRGRGIGKRFFDLREEHARDLGRETTAFCAVDRPADHPLRPMDYRPLDPFWSFRGYEKRPALQARFHWKEIGAELETEHTLTYWTRSWIR